MKKVLALMLSSMLALAMLTACNSGGGSPTGGGSTDNNNNETSSPSGGDGLSAYDQAIADRTSTVKLVVAAMNWIGPMDAQSEVQEAMNQLTRETLNIEIELLFMDSASYRQQIGLMLAGGDQVDLFNAIGPGYTNVINNGYVIDLEENGLLENYGPGIIELRGDDLDGLRFNGTLYGVPVHKDDAIGQDAYVFGADYVNEVGFEYTSGVINKVTQAEVDQLMADLHEAFPDKDVIVPQAASVLQTLKVDDLGSDRFGVLLDPLNSLEVSDLFSSQLYYDFCQRWYDWNQMGYLAGDALTNEMAATTQVRVGTAMGYMSAMKPGIVSQEGNLIGQEAVCLQVGDDFKKSSAFTSMPWCIGLNTVDEVAAMQYLNELYTNAELSTLLCWGREGIEYVLTDDGHKTFPEGVDADTSGYLHNVNWEMPNQFIAGVWEGDDLTLWDEMGKFNSNADTSIAMGFTFDNSALSTEYTALTNIYEEYYKQLEFGFLDPATGIPEMLNRMESAGLQKYIDEKQAQIDAWAAN